MSKDKVLFGVSSLIDITDSVLESNGYARTECKHGVDFNSECESCEYEDAREAQYAAEAEWAERGRR